MSRVRAVIAAALGASLLVTVGGTSVRADPSPPDAARRAAERFLDRYVDDDGRVVRHDQGGDTVSEGQAYAMLVAQAIGDREHFERAWGWAQANLERGDGLLSWRWQGGAVVDPMPATDGDLDTAWALLLGADRFGEPSYRTDAIRIADAVLAQESVAVGRDIVLVAGPWARVAPFSVNPSYFSPAAFAALQRATGDARWAVVADTSRRLLETLAATAPLPPDWVQVDATGVVQPAPTPAVGIPEFGLDAARVVVRFAAECGTPRRLVRSAQPVLADGPWRARALTGEPRDSADHPAFVVAAAAAAHADGNRRARTALLERAERMNERRPSYYGSAWIALGRLMLTGDTMTSCSDPPSRKPIPTSSAGAASSEATESSSRGGPIRSAIGRSASSANPYACSRASNRTPPPGADRARLHTLGP